MAGAALFGHDTGRSESYVRTVSPRVRSSIFGVGSAAAFCGNPYYCLPNLATMMNAIENKRSDNMFKRQSKRRMRPMNQGTKRAVVTALVVVSSLGVAGFSSSRPMVSKVDSLLSGRSPCNAVSTSSLSTERLDTRQQGINPGSPLDMLCKDQHEFELSVGHAMDVLRDDYPLILTSNPGTRSRRSLEYR